MRMAVQLQERSKQSPSLPSLHWLKQLSTILASRELQEASQSPHLEVRLLTRMHGQDRITLALQVKTFLD